MKRARTTHRRLQKGSALILSLMFVIMFFSLAVAVAGMSGANVQIAENHRKIDTARSCAESGLEVLRYWLNKIEISGTTPEELRFDVLYAKLADVLKAGGATNIKLCFTGSAIMIDNVSLDSSLGKTFSAVLTKVFEDDEDDPYDDDDVEGVQVDVTGHYKSFNRKIRTKYEFEDRADTVFDFGVASKGPVSLSGNVDLAGVNLMVESNAYIESENTQQALLIVGNSQIAGEVKIVNPYAYVYLQGGKAGIGGDTGADAMDHVKIGVGACEFPEMNPGAYAGYATNTLTGDTTADASYENLRIPANRNPNFSGQVTLKGVIFIEAPNVVTFSGGVDITGIIVTNGDSTDNSGTNQLVFTGNVAGHPVTELPQTAQFAGLHDDTGTFIMAPGFHVGFGGSFSTLSGAIAANGIQMWGNAGGVINGSIINYSDAQMTLQGNTDLYFNRSGLSDVPAGFVPRLILEYDNSSYMEI
jgi:hypothetical protein